MNDQNRRGGIRRAIKTMFNFPLWMGWRDIRNNAAMINQLTSDLFKAKKMERQETYEQAIQRLHLTQDHLMRRQKQLLQMSLFYFAVMVLLIIYTVYLCYVGTIVSVIMSGVLVLVVASLAFREHFWYFQMREKRLGCSLKSWCLFLLSLERK